MCSTWCARYISFRARSVLILFRFVLFFLRRCSKLIFNVLQFTMRPNSLLFECGQRLTSFKSNYLNMFWMGTRTRADCGRHGGFWALQTMTIRALDWMWREKSATELWSAYFSCSSCTCANVSRLSAVILYGFWFFFIIFCFRQMTVMLPCA